jgi:hypothetical protein
MKKLMMACASIAAVFALSGCGGGNGYYDELTYYLQTYDEYTDRYEGVSGVYYECGYDYNSPDPDYTGYTGLSGAFTMIEGDYCTFYDLDDTLSYEYDLLYIGTSRDGRYTVDRTRYDCDSGLGGYTDEYGSFLFDPTYISNYSDGDVCGFEFW